jgi:hypothetical protein
MKFAKYTFMIGGILGLTALLPQYLMENKVGTDNPPAITHPEFFYGFLGVAIAFQIAFLIIASDPVKYRLMILPSIVEKFSFGIAVVILFLTGRAAGQIVIAAALDLILGILFIISWYKLAPNPDIPNASESIN